MNYRIATQFLAFILGLGLSTLLFTAYIVPEGSKTQSGHVFLLTPNGKINLGDYVGEYSANKNQTVWMDKNGAKHMTTAAVEFIESKKKK